jgi:hypothetical protein
LENGDSFNLLRDVPRDLFRMIFQYLSLQELIDFDKSLERNKVMSSSLFDSLKGFVLPEVDTSNDFERIWIFDRQVLVATLELDGTSSTREYELIFRSQKTLKSLYLKYEVDANFIASRICNFPSLTVLSFRACQTLEAEVISSLLKLQPQLLSLSLSNMTQLSAELLEVIVEYCPNLHELTLEYNKWIDDDSITLLTKGCRKLKYLDIVGTLICEDDTLRLLIQSFPELNSISLPFDDFSDEVISLFMRQVIFRSIWSDDSKSQTMAIDCLSLENRAELLSKCTFSPL